LAKDHLQDLQKELRKLEEKLSNRHIDELDELQKRLNVEFENKLEDKLTEKVGEWEKEKEELENKLKAALEGNEKLSLDHAAKWKQQEETIQRKEAEQERQHEEHQKMQSSKLLSYFSDGAGDSSKNALNMTAMLKEGLGVWKEAWKEVQFQKQEDKRQADLIAAEEEATRKREELRKEQQLHMQTRGDMLVKYFDNKINGKMASQAAKREGFGLWKENWMRWSFGKASEKREQERAEEEMRRIEEERVERSLQVKTRSDMMTKYFSDTLSPALNDLAIKKEAFAAWKAQYAHFAFLKAEERRKEESRLRDEAELRRKEEEKKERALELKTRGDMMIKYFENKVVNPKFANLASLKEALGVWKKQWMHAQFVQSEEGLKQELQDKLEDERRKREEDKKERELHAKSRSDMVMKYFSERVSPAVHGLACKKEGWNAWKEEYLKDQAAQDEARVQEERRKEKELHMKTRSDSLVKYFADSASPEVRDAAAKKESFGLWKEDFMHNRFEMQEEMLMRDRKLRAAEDQRRAEEMALERKIHKKTRSDMMIKYFGAKVSPAVYDSAAKKETFGVWKEDFVHKRYAAEEARRLEEYAREKEIEAKSRGDGLVKYFSETVSPAVHDAAAKKESFGLWKAEFMRDRFAKQEQRRNRERLEAEARRHEELRQERELHRKSRSDIMIKYFSEKISPALHDNAGLKEAFGIWKEDFMHTRWEAHEAAIREERDREKEIHKKTRSDGLVKYFSDSLSGGTHDIAVLKEGFGVWKEEFLHERFVRHEKALAEDRKYREEEDAKRMKEQALEKQIHKKTRSDMMIKYFSEKVSGGIDDLAAKKEAWGVWKEEFIHDRYTQEQARRLDEHAKERKLHKTTRSNMTIKYFSEKVSPLTEKAKKNEGFGAWKEYFLHKRFEKEERQRKEGYDRSSAEAEKRRREEAALERKLHGKTQSAKMVKYFSERVSPALHDTAAKKEAYGTWKEQFVHERFLEREEALKASHLRIHDDAEERRRAQSEEERKLQRKTQSSKMIKYFSEKVSPAIHDAASKKEAWGIWKEDFIHCRYAVEEARRLDQHKKERSVHKNTRSNMMIKYFSERVSPALHDSAAKKEGFGAWKEDFMHNSFAREEDALRNDAKARHEEQVRRLEEAALERKIHSKTRGDLVIKMFSEKISPAVHDLAAKKEAWGVWKEDFIHDRYAVEEARRLEQHAKERQVHKSTRSGMMLKYFSEKVAPATHDKAAKHEGFGVWKEDYMHDKFAREEKMRQQGHEQSHIDAEERRRKEFALERKLHGRTQSAKMMKYFSEKVSPAVHDSAAKKEGFGTWKEQYVHEAFLEREAALTDGHKQTVDDTATRRTEQLRKEHQLEKKAQQQKMMKYFSEKVAPGVHDVAAKKEAFTLWDKEYIHLNYAVDEARRAEQRAKEKKLHNKTRSDMMVKLFSEKVSPAVHDLAAKKEGWGILKEQFVHESFVKQEQQLHENHKLRAEEEARRLNQVRLEHKIHMKTKGDMIIKLFSEKISPAVHDLAAKKEAWGTFKEDFIHHRYAKEEKLRLAEANKEQQQHQSERRDMIIKYFAEKVSPSVHDAAALKEGFAEWKEVFMHDIFGKREEEIQKGHEAGYQEAQERRKKEAALERKIHRKTQGDKMIKYFAERVSPAIHDVAAKKEGFGAWKEQFMHDRFGKQEAALRDQHQETREEHERRVKQLALEHETHKKTQSAKMMKYFSEKVSPGVHDVAAKKEALGAWKEEFIHDRYAIEEARRQEQREKEQKVRKAARSSMMIKYFAEKVGPIHDVAAKKEGFGVWKEQFMHEDFAKQEKLLSEDAKERREAVARQRAEHLAERQLHRKTRSDMMVKYFAEKVGPIHDVAAKKEGFGLWKEDFIHDRFAKEEKRRLQQHAKEKQVHKNTRSSMMLKYFSEKVAPATHDKAAKHEGFGAWKEDFMHSSFAKEEAKLRAEHSDNHEEHQRRHAQLALEHELHKKTQSAKMMKYFSERVAPGVHDVAAKKEAFGTWKEQFSHEQFLEREAALRGVHDANHEAHERRHAQLALEHELHKKTQSAKMMKYFSEKVSPGVHDVAAKKEALGVWKEDFIHDRYAKEEARRLKQQSIERKLHKEARSSMMLKYFSEKVSPATHDKAAKHEGFGIWKEDFLHERFETREEALRAGHKQSHNEAEERRRKQFELERKLHKSTQSSKMMKYFSERVAPGVHDVAAKKESFGIWKEDFIHGRYADEEARRLAQQKKERSAHKNTRSNMMIKYFSEKVSPAIHDVAVKKEGFGAWREDYLHIKFAKEEEERRNGHDQSHAEAEARRRKEFALERKIHKKTQSDKMIKYFSEKVSPALHDVACKKEGLGIWKEQFFHTRFLKREEAIREGHKGSHEEAEARRQEEEARRQKQFALERKLQRKAQSDRMVKYFSEKVAPGVHDVAAKKEAFGFWEKDFIHDCYEVDEARRRDQHAKEKKVHKSTRSGMMLKYFSEKVAPATHDKAAKHEGFGVWKEQFLHDSFAQQEAALHQDSKLRLDEEARRRKQQAFEHEMHKKTNSAKMLKYFSEKVSPGVHDVAAKKEGFGVWKEDFIHDRYAQDEARRLKQSAMERKLHKNTRSNMMIKYFSESVGPLHDKAAKKEGLAGPGVGDEEFTGFPLEFCRNFTGISQEFYWNFEGLSMRISKRRRSLR